MSPPPRAPAAPTSRTRPATPPRSPSFACSSRALYPTSARVTVEVMAPVELMVPPAVHEDPDAFEILRVWAASGEQHVTIHSDLNGGAEGFGTLLAELLRHGALLYSERETAEPLEVETRIRAAFEAELAQALPWPTGGVI